MIKHFKKSLLILFALLSSCQDTTTSVKEPKSIEDIRNVELENSSGMTLNTRLSIGPYENSLGLSGVRPDQFGDNQGLLFFFLGDEDRSFWMPDTYFDLDIIFLDKNFKIIHIEKKVPAHPGRNEPPQIPRTKVVNCRYVLEIKSNTKFGSNLMVGDRLIFKSKYSSEKIGKFILKNYF